MVSKVQRNFAILIASAAVATAAWAQGSESFDYDALGRLTRVTFADGKIIEYTYDAAGNRKSSGPPAANGVFTFVGGSHTRRNSTGGVATGTFRNTGTTTITGITYSCTGGSWYQSGSSPTSIAPQATATFSCTAAASGSNTVLMTIRGAGASNSPFTPPAW